MFDIETDVLIVGSGPGGGRLGGAPVQLRRAERDDREILLARQYAARAYHQPAHHGDHARTRRRGRGLQGRRAAGADGQQRLLHLAGGRGGGPAADLGQPPQPARRLRARQPLQDGRHPQTLLEPIIFGKAMREGCLARFKTEYLSHTQDADGVVATVRDRVADQTYRIRAKYMIGADGGRSQIVQDLGLPLDGQEGLAGSMNIEFDADLTHLVAHRPSVLYWVFQPGSAGGIGAGVLRMIRPWNKWLGMWNYDVAAGPARLFRRGDPPDPLPPDRRGGAAQGHAGQLLDGQQHRGAPVFPWRVHLHGRRRASPSADQRAGLEHLDPGRLQPRLEAEAGAGGHGRPQPARHLQRRAATGGQADRHPCQQVHRGYAADLRDAGA
jgi:hypothetical protein